MKFSALNPGGVKDIDKKAKRVVSYPSTFDVIDSGREVVEKGAFKRTIQAWGPEGKRRIKPLYQHDPAWLLGKVTSLKEDDRGLLAESVFSDTPLANDVLTLINDEVITEQSIGYDVILADNDDNGVRHLRELRLYEYSFVTWGMNEITPIVNVKEAGGKPQLLKRIERFEKALKDSTFESDDVPHLMTIALSSWQEALRTDEKPFAGYEDFADCVDDNQDKDSPEAFCAWLEEQTRVLHSLKGLKEGRVLSTRNVSLIEEAIEALTALLQVANSDKSTLPQDPPVSAPLEDLLDSFRSEAAYARAKVLERELSNFASELKLKRSS